MYDNSPTLLLQISLNSIDSILGEFIETYFIKVNILIRLIDSDS
jgi:hypothetical protein